MVVHMNCCPLIHAVVVEAEIEAQVKVWAGRLGRQIYHYYHTIP